MTPQPSPAPAARRWSRTALRYAGAGAAVVLVVSLLAGAGPYTQVGLQDPGALVRIGTPLLRLLLDAAATVCTGALVFAAFFTRRQPTGLISPAAFGALRTAGRAAIVWAVAALLLWPFDTAGSVGLPLRSLLRVPALASATRALPGPKAWLVTAVLAAGLAVAARRTLRWRATPLLAALAVLATLPVITAGHSSSDTDHDIATGAIALHIPAAVIWLGTLVALLRARGLGADRPAALRRYARLSAGCWWVVAFSGLVDAAVLAPGTSTLTTGFGTLLLLKAALLTLLGAVLLRTRRRLLTDAGSPRLLTVELGALIVAFGLSVALTDLPAPKFLIDVVTGDQTLLGYNLSHPPTALRLALDWRLEVLFAPLSVALAAAYLAGIRRLRGGWPLARTAWWLAGCVVLLVATSSGLGRYAPAMFSVEAVDHMLIGMLAPMLLALGAPLTLAAAALTPAGLDGPAQWLSRAQGSRWARALTQPVFVTVLFAGLPFLLYFTVAYDLTVRFHWAHLAMDLLFLVVGWLFAWTVLGPDPTPRPTPSLLRLGLLLVAMPFDLLFAGAILATRQVIGNGSASANLYQAVALPWVPSLLADQRLGAYLALLTSELVMFAMLIVVVTRWRPTAPDPDYQQLVDALHQRAPTGLSGYRGSRVTEPQ